MANLAETRKTFPATAFILALLFSAVAGTQFTNSVSGNPWGPFGPPPEPNPIYIRSDGSIEPSTVPIRRVGNIYIFTENLINYTIEVQRNNIVIDGAGFKLEGNGYYGWIKLLNRTGVRIQNLTIGNGGCINIEQGSNNTIIGNKIDSSTCISLHSSNGNQIIDNSLSSGYGIQGSGSISSFNLILRNTFTSGLSGGGNGVGISLPGFNNTITRNTFTDESSIQLWGNYNTISYNNLVSGMGGITISGSYNSIFGNAITGKSQEALYLGDSLSNTVYENQISSNGIGVQIGGFPGYPTYIFNSTKNIFYRNNFEYNGQNVFIINEKLANFWDNGREGNYWSNYTGMDMNGDGIGDTSYEMDANNTDYHPLIKPVDILGVEDLNPPIISVISPETRNYASSNVSLTLTVDKPTSWMGYSLDGQAYVTVLGNTTLTLLSEGMHSLTAYAEDMAGNEGSSTVIFTVDTIPPLILILSPADKTYDTSNIPLNFTVSESVSQITYSLDGEENVTITGNMTLSKLANGDHNLTVYAKDKAGSVGASETTYFSVDAPFPTTLVIAPIASAAVIGLGLLVCFRKRNH
jgi:nitrous oxidase accessory protein NosD